VSTGQPKKRAVNLLVDVELFDAARRMKINISESLERRLRAVVRAKRENAGCKRTGDDFVNQCIHRHGLLANRLCLRP
jgi:post-segregation antitoxin (ccd killing protein)